MAYNRHLSINGHGEKTIQTVIQDILLYACHVWHVEFQIICYNVPGFVCP